MVTSAVARFNVGENSGFRTGVAVVGYGEVSVPLLVVAWGIVFSVHRAWWFLACFNRSKTRWHLEQRNCSAEPLWYFLTCLYRSL